MDKRTKILQCNIQSVFKNKEEIYRVLRQENYIAAVLAETWTALELEDTNKYKISKYHRILASRDDGYGGAAVYLRNDLGYQPIQLPSLDNYTQAVAVKVLKFNLVIVSVYFSPSGTTSAFEEDVSKILDTLRNERRVIIGGDWNAHHGNWGNRSNDRRGNILTDLIASSEFVLMNDGSNTYIPIEQNKQPSAIDLTLCSPELISELSWNTLDYGIGGSHHIAIEISMATEENKDEYIYNNNKIAEGISKLCATSINTVSDLHKAVTKIRKNSRTKNTYTPKFWWCEAVEQAWLGKRDARREFNRKSSLDNLLHLKKKAAVFQKCKREEIKKKIEEFPQQISPFLSSKELWNRVNRLTGKGTRKKENNCISEDEDMANEFLNLHFGQHEVRYPGTCGITPTYNILNIEKWNEIISRKKNTAPGHDTITFDMLRKLTPSVVENMVQDLNNMWRNMFLPIAMKTITIVAIPKAGKPQHTIHGKRPISLVPTLTKVLNSAVLDGLQQNLEDQKLIPDTCFGFRKGLSTATCLSFVINEVKSAKRQNQVVAVIFVDLSNAFNSVKFEKVEEIMNEKRIPAEITCWVTEFLRNRQINMRVNEKVVTRQVSDGLPQGDVLSPTLFNIYTSKLHEIQQEGVILVQYADDFGIVVKGKNLQEVNQRGQRYVNIFSTKAKELNLQVNPDKTKAMVFINSDKKVDIKIGNTELETVRVYRYLGVQLDRSLSFGTHMREITRKINDRLSMLKVISGIRNGGHPQSMLPIYQALVRSVFEYGGTIISNAAKTNLNKVVTVNNQCLRRVTGCTKTTPINTLLAISAQQPIQCRQEYLTAREIIRCIVNNNIVGKQLKLLEGTASDDRLSYMEIVYLKHRQTFEALMTKTSGQQLNVDIGVDLEGMNSSKRNCNAMQMKQLALYTMNGKYKNRPRIYTDASKDRNVCGIGVYDEKLRRKYSFKLRNETSVTSAEVIAIHMALTIVEENEMYGYVVLTDSKSACIIMQEAKVTKTRIDAIQDILEKAARWNVSIQWIPSHVNLAGNEEADRLAKHGTGDSALEIANKISEKDASWKIKNHSMETANTWYKTYAEEKGQKFFQLQTTIDSKPWFHGRNIDNRETRLLNRLMAGHDYSRYWLAKMKIVDDSYCDICDERETAEHCILHCVRFGNVRENYSFDGRYRNMIELFKTKNEDLFKEVCRFVNECQLKF